MIPEEKQAFTFHGMRFVVLKREKNRITRLRIRPLGDVAATVIAPPPLQLPPPARDPEPTAVDPVRPPAE